MKLNVTHTATLANLPLSKNEINIFEKQMDETITYIDKLAEIDTKNIAPTSNVTGLENIMREDTIEPSLTQKEALANATQTYEGYIEVANILDTD